MASNTNEQITFNEEKLVSESKVDADEQVPIAARARLSKVQKKFVVTNAAENWRMVLSNRNSFIKHGRMGKPHARKVVVNVQTGDVSWNGEPKGLNVKNLVSVSNGKLAGKAFQRDWAFDVDENLCFVLHFVSRDVCLQAQTTKQRDSFVEAIQACSSYFQENKFGISKYRRRKSEILSSEAAGNQNSTSNVISQSKIMVQTQSATMDPLPDRALSKHMQRQKRRASTKI